MEEELLIRNKQRAECYKLLSACYCMPGKMFIEEGLVDGLIKALGPVCPEAVPYAREMADALSRYDMRNEILVDYSALFIGPFKLLAPPYGSVYLDVEKLLMGDTTVDAVAAYRKAGVEMDRDEHKDIPDHISVELEFMYYLMVKELEALSNSDTEGAAKYAGMRDDFRRKHLGAWAFKFIKNVKEEARNPFYKNLALCTEAFLQQEMERDAAVARTA